MDALAVLHRLPFLVGQRTDRMVVEAPGPAILVVDRDPEMAVDRMVAAWRHHREARHHPGRDAPVVVSFFRVAARADVEAAVAVDHFEYRALVAHIVLIAARALEQRIAVEVAAVQPG